jgi:hypothetical protein
MADEFAALDGDPIGLEDLALPKTRQVAEFFTRTEYPYGRLVEARRFPDGREGLVFDLVVEVGQEPANDIRPVERIAVTFDIEDRHYPEVLALRMDFPEVPHRNLRSESRPTSLCLYDQPYRDIQLSWTAAGFIQRIREWLALTAEGKLHADDQPLEPILLGPFNTLIIPSDLSSKMERPGAEHLYVTARNAGPRGAVLVGENQKSAGKLDLVATAIWGKPQTHGIIQSCPRTLFDLHNLLLAADVDLLAELETRLFQWERDTVLLNAKFAVIAFLPKTRVAGGASESLEIRTFATATTVAELGVEIGIWSMNCGFPGRLIPRDPSKRGKNVQVEVLNTVFGLSRALAASLNGLPGPDEQRIAAIGVGALGSQLIMNLIRTGYGSWTLVDDDYFLPHNAARHQLPSNVAGFPKAVLMAAAGNAVLEKGAVVGAVVANVLEPGENTEATNKAMAEADLIADFSASVSVCRYLARDLHASARRISVFLNPSGTDLILLAEGQARELPLDQLEMQYYREILRNPCLARHLEQGPGKIRYADSCRDLTSTVSQDLVALNAAIGSRAFRDAAISKGATIGIWSAGPNLCVSTVVVAPAPVTACRFGDWELCFDTLLMKTIRDLRKAKLPNETGGVLIGSFDHQRKIAYIVDTIPSPADSEEWPTLYIRGSKGLKAEVAAARQRTRDMLHYVGEWHSHPDGYSCAPSGDDRKVFTWLNERMNIDGAPGLMLIAGQDEHAWFLGTMS